MFGTIVLKGGGTIENIISCSGCGNTALKVYTKGNEDYEIVPVAKIFSIIF